MSTKETLPPDEEFIKWAWNNGLGWIDSDNLSRIFRQATDSLRTRLDAAEKELASLQLIEWQTIGSDQNTQKEIVELQKANVELVKDKERVSKLANLIWQTRWVSEDSDYQDLVGIAAEIRSGNFNGIDTATAKGTQ